MKTFGPLQISTAQIEDSAISTAKIATDAVTPAKLDVTCVGAGMQQEAGGELGLKVDETTTTLLQTAITLATEILADIDAHAADGAMHTGTTGPDTDNFPTGIVAPTNLATLIAIITCWLDGTGGPGGGGGFPAHMTDALLGAAWVYHAAQGTDYSLASVVAPTTLDECITRLNNIKLQFNLHDNDAVAHAVGSGLYQVAAADATSNLLISDGGVDTTQIAADAVDKAKIAADVIGAGLAQEADGSIKLKPDESTMSILQTAIALATELLTDMDAHAADAARHTTAIDNVNFPTGIAAPTDLTTLIAIITEWLDGTGGPGGGGYPDHNEDAILGGGWTFHNAQGTTYVLASVVAPTTLNECITRLNNIKLQFNLHDNDAASHAAVGGTHQVAAADATDNLLIANLGVDGPQIALNAVGSTKIAADSVTTSKMTKTEILKIFIAGTLGTNAGILDDGVLEGEMTLSVLEADDEVVKIDDGGVFADDGLDAADVGADDVNPFTAFAQTNDAFYVGHTTTKFCGLRVEIGTVPATLTDMILEYWNGAWVTVPIYEDGTEGFVALTGNWFLLFEPPADWIANAVDGFTAFWVRWREQSGPSGNQPDVTQIFMFRVDAGNGIPIPYAGTISKATFIPKTISALNNDSIFLIVNVTAGTWDTITYTAGENQDQDATISLAVSVDDEIVMIQIQEDGTTEMADLEILLEIDL